MKPKDRWITYWRDKAGNYHRFKRRFSFRDMPGEVVIEDRLEYPWYNGGRDHPDLPIHVQPKADNG